MSPWIGILAEQDQRAFLLVIRWRLHFVNQFMRSVTRLGDASTTIGVSLLLISGLLPQWVSAGRSAMFLLIVSHLGVQLLKRGVGRPRPNLPGNAPLIHAPDRFSFPSGHAAASLSIAIPVAALLPPPVSLALLGLALLVGFSRCYLGVHYPGDVVAGWMLVLLARALELGLG